MVYRGYLFVNTGDLIVIGLKGKNIIANARSLLFGDT